jgi:hypothetical protein
MRDDGFLQRKNYGLVFRVLAESVVDRPIGRAVVRESQRWRG